MVNQQQSPEQGNVQRLERKLVHLTVETGSTLTAEAEGEDIVQRNSRPYVKCGSREQFLAQALAKYGNKFDYDLTDFIGMTQNPIGVICPQHGRFEQLPHTFLLVNCKTGCKQCGLESKNRSKTKSYDQFIVDAKKIHGDQYSYPESNRSLFLNRRSKITIHCNTHHTDSLKSAQKHLSGHGCWQCKVEQLIREGVLVGGYSEQLFSESPHLKSEKACLYYLSINDGQFYKLGISKNLKTRLRGIRCKSKGLVKSLEVLWTVESDLYDCFKKEQLLMKQHAEFRIARRWSTELFSKNILPKGLLLE